MGADRVNGTLLHEPRGSSQASQCGRVEIAGLVSLRHLVGLAIEHAFHACTALPGRLELLLQGRLYVQHGCTERA
jgi:hypothetical protein